MGGWSDMSCLERAAKIVMVLAFLVIFLCFAMNVYMIYRAAADTWFTPCRECKDKDQGGKEDCVRCCTDCSKKDEVFYYIFRAYNLIFCIIGMVAELRIQKFYEFAKICAFFFPRGFWQVFLGLMTVQSTTYDPSDALYADIVGYGLAAVGFCHFCLGICCYSEYSEEGREKEYANRTGGGGDQAAGYGGGAAYGGGAQAGAGGQRYEEGYGHHQNYGPTGPSTI